MKSPRTILWICLFLVFSVPVSGLGSSNRSGTGENFFVLLSKDNLLTVKVIDIPLEKVLTEVANQGSVEILFQAPVIEHIRIDFSGLSLEKGLKRLIRDYNSVFIYGRGKTGNSELRLNKVILYAKRGESADRSYRPRKVAPRNAKRPAPTHSKAQRRESRERIAPDSNGVIRQKTVKAQADSENDQSVIHFGKILASDGDESVRADAAQALGELKDEMAIVPLIQALRDNDTIVRESAVTALSQIGGENVIRALEGCLSDKDEELRKVATDVLERLKEGQ